MLSRIVAYAGLSRPYRFERTLLVLFVLGLAMVYAIAVWRLLHRVEGLPLKGPRGLYVCYLGALLVLSVALLRWPRLAWTLAILALLDLSWGYGSDQLKMRGMVASSLLPSTVSLPTSLRHHPLLQVAPIPSISVTNDMGHRFAHTSRGTRGKEPAVDGKIVIALFGGSTTYDIGVGEGDAWADRLGELLGDRYAVINHGVPGHSTAENLIATAFYEDKFARPKCAVYYIGWNDQRSAHIPDLDPGYADYHLPGQIDWQQVRRFGGTTISPTLTLLVRLLGYAVDTLRPPAAPEATPSANDDPALETIYARNVQTMSAINRSRGITSIWVGQLLNPAKLTAAAANRYDWIPLVLDRDVWPMQKRLNRLLAETAAGLGDRYVDAPELPDADFVDKGHFSASGARKFAAILSPVLQEACR